MNPSVLVTVQSLEFTIKATPERGILTNLQVTRGRGFRRDSSLTSNGLLNFLYLTLMGFSALLWSE